MATLLPNGKVLVVGGRAQLFDPVSNTWLPTADIEIPRAGATSTLLPDGKVLVVGGFTESGEPTATAELYDPAGVANPTKPEIKGSWSAQRKMALPRLAHTATLLPSGKVLVTGGSYAERTRLASSEIYDPATGRWDPAAPMSTGRASFTATALKDGSVLVAGGSAAVATDGATSPPPPSAATLPLPSAELYTAANLPDPEPATKPGSGSPAAIYAVMLLVILGLAGFAIHDGLND